MSGLVEVNPMQDDEVSAIEDDTNDCVCCGDNPPGGVDESGLCEQCGEEYGG
jgi:hypothetical protein